MSITGLIVDGKVVLDRPVPLPDGTPVRIEPLSANGADETPSAHRPRTLADRLKNFFGHRVDLPPDSAEQHDHYLYGTPKK
jgi:hypothetical protein